MRTDNKVMLNEMAGQLNEQFARYLDRPVASHTPYDWWKRTKNGDISEPLPKPIIVVGNSPVFRWNEIIAWFVRYRGIGSKVSLKQEGDT